LFSTALSNEALETSRRFMDKPVIIIVPRDEELKDIRQYCLKVDNEEKKLSKFYALLKIVEVTKVIIFVNTKDKVISLTEEVGNHYTVSASHDGMDQRARDIAIQKFKSGSSTILIATDLRGTSTVQVPIVINYDMPTQLMQYIHRVQQQNGQQHGRRSVVINFATPGDERVLFDIQKFCNRQLMELPSNI
jgi:translation initiation factor 4A